MKKRTAELIVEQHKNSLFKIHYSHDWGSGVINGLSGNSREELEVFKKRFEKYLKKYALESRRHTFITLLVEKELIGNTGSTVRQFIHKWAERGVNLS